MQQVKTAISSIKIEKSTTCDGLTVFPLMSERQSALLYLLLEDGLRDDLASIREVSESGNVPDLTVENRADLPLLIIDGEELVGAKQNRVANLTMLLPANQTTIIPVSCVEAGRWAYDRDDFAVTERVHFSRGREEKLASVYASKRATGSNRSDQSKVWTSIDEKAARMQAESPTGAMGSIFERHSKNLNDYVQAITPAATQVGAIFVIGRRRFGLDLFDQPDTFAAFLPKLVRSYAIDAMEQPSEPDASVPATEAEAFLERMGTASFNDYPAVGLGRDAGVIANGLTAGALVVEENIVHLTAFSEPWRHQAKPDPTDLTDHYSSYRQRRHSLHRRYADLENL